MTASPASPSPSPSATTANPARALLRVVVLALALAGAAIFAPLWGPLVLAAWVAHLARPLQRWIAGHLGRRGAKSSRASSASGVVTTIIVLAILAPLAAMTVVVVASARDLWATLERGGGDALSQLMPSNAHIPSFSDLRPDQILAFIGAHRSEIMQMASGTLSATLAVAVGFLVFVLGLYTFAADGDRYYRWAERTLPIAPHALRRLTDAFHETGRGLLVGSGLTAVAQAVIATIAYVALGVPRAITLGFVTLVAALFPTFGTALVWVPVAAALALNGEAGKAGILAAVGVLVVSSVDNVLRPLLSRVAKLDLPTFVLLVAMFGGLAIAGGWGLLLGPLVVRLASEALALARDDALFAPRGAPPEAQASDEA